MYFAFFFLKYSELHVVLWKYIWRKCTVKNYTTVNQWIIFLYWARCGGWREGSNQDYTICIGIDKLSTGIAPALLEMLIQRHIKSPLPLTICMSLLFKQILFAIQVFQYLEDPPPPGLNPLITITTSQNTLQDVMKCKVKLLLARY